MFRRRTVLSGMLLPIVPACGSVVGERTPPPAGDDAGEPGTPPGADATAADRAGPADGRADSPGPDAGASPDAAPADTAADQAGAADASAAGALQRIGFGSCNRMDQGSQAFWQTIIGRQPEAFLFLGDAIYVDHGDTYPKLWAVAGFKQLMAMSRPFVIWDDHDYGGNDTNSSYGDRAGAKKRFLDFWSARGAIAMDSPRWTREGNYDATIVGPPGREVQFLMLDNRYFKGNPPNGMLLGNEQWAWLAGELRKPARLRILMSGMELISTSTTPEGWGLFKNEQQRFYDTLKDSGAKGLLILSGDKHYCEISRRDDLGLGYPLYDFTSSPMNAPPEPLEANKYRDTPDASISDHNFGLITIDWAAADPTLHIQLIHATRNTVLLERRLTLSALGA
jgi:alkaline phosphatase D